MRLLELSLRNYRVFEEVDLELPARAIGIVGPNGAGKSTLVESILFALYGVDGARTKKDGIRTTGLLTDCVVRLTFEHGGQHYEVRRTIAGKNARPDAELYVGGKLLATGVSDVDEQIRRALRMDLRVFTASVVAEQKQLDAFSDVTAAKRKDMALRLLGIKPVDDARIVARREARTAKQTAEDLAGLLTDLAALEAEVKEAAEAAEEAAAEVARRRTAVEAEEARARDARAAFEAADVLRQRVETLTVEITHATERRDELRVGAARLRERLEALEQEQDAIAPLEEELAGLAGADERLALSRRFADRAGEAAELRGQLEAYGTGDAAEELADLAAAAAALEAARGVLATARAGEEHATGALTLADEALARAGEADPSEPCPVCGRPLGEDYAGFVRHRKDQRRTAAAAAAAAKKERVAAERAAKAAEAAHRTAAAAADAARRDADRRRALQERLAAIEAEGAEVLAHLGGGPPPVPELEAAVKRERELGERLAGLRAGVAHRDQLRDDLTSATEQLEAIEERLSAAVADAGALAFDAAAHAALATARDGAEEVLEAARAAERTASTAESEARTLAGGLAGRLSEATETERKARGLRDEARVLDRVAVLLDGFRDHLVARVGPELSREAEALFRELTNGEYDDLRIDEDDLSIRIADGERYFAIDRFSGSESDLANLALRVAISAHLSRVSGADVGLLILDEVFGSLDQERRDLLVQAMGMLAGRFHQLLVITHAEQVKDRFPAAIQVMKVGRRRSVAVTT
ncbi:MAG TPA: SMC family ATPase [Actinomycetota bacterium]|nr:SMC family ATPase [Actinomycetota bacterium]